MNAKSHALLCRGGLQLAIIAITYAIVVATFRLLPLLVFALVAFLFYRHRRSTLSGSSGAFGTARWADMLDALHAGLFSGRGLLFGHFAGPSPHRLQAVILLFTLPADESALAVRIFLAAFVWGRA